jgi:Domain of unknown function (DUF222)/HNH endonuclease
MPEAPQALRELEAACAGLLETWAGALLSPSRDTQADVAAMSDDGLVRTTEALAVLNRRVQALQARCAAGVATRSRGVEGADLAREHGFSTPERLIAQTTGGRYTDAARLVAVGQAIAHRASLTGEVLPPKHPHVATALDSGALCVDAAEMIRRFLDHLKPSVARDEVNAAEEFLVDRAPVVGIDGITRLIKHLEAHLDPDGVKPREDELRAQRSLKIWEDASGMINLRGAFDPANGAPIKLAIETLVGAELHRARDAKPAFGDTRRTGDAESVDPVVEEDRTIVQLNADALADIARLSLSTSDAPAALRSAVVVTRIDLDAFVSGQGHATIDGIDQPVSVATAHEIAASAGVAPLLIDPRCAKLDLGRAARLFSFNQKIALAERDGGCAFPGCNRPPSHTQAHHIRWLKRDKGRTDLDNGILLCSHHHHRVHDDGWHIFVRDGRTWFTPPAHVDTEQCPRPGNTAAPRLLAGHLAEHRAHGTRPRTAAAPDRAA